MMLRTATLGSSRKPATSKNSSGLRPNSSMTVAATATKTASTEVRPCSAQYTSSR